MQYTPGPWFIVDNEIRPTISGPLIATVNHSGRKQEIAEGNENLICAAPDLAEALEKAVNLSGENEYGGEASWIPLAIRALAKSKGEM